MFFGPFGVCLTDYNSFVSLKLYYILQHWSARLSLIVLYVDEFRICTDKDTSDKILRSINRKKKILQKHFERQFPIIRKYSSSLRYLLYVDDNKIDKFTIFVEWHFTLYNGILKIIFISKFNLQCTHSLINIPTVLHACNTRYNILHQVWCIVPHTYIIDKYVVHCFYKFFVVGT